MYKYIYIFINIVYYYGKYCLKVEIVWNDGFSDDII